MHFLRKFLALSLSYLLLAQTTMAQTLNEGQLEELQGFVEVMNNVQKRQEFLAELGQELPYHYQAQLQNSGDLWKRWWVKAELLPDQKGVNLEVKDSKGEFETKKITLELGARPNTILLAGKGLNLDNFDDFPKLFKHLANSKDFQGLRNFKKTGGVKTVLSYIVGDAHAIMFVISIAVMAALGAVGLGLGVPGGIGRAKRKAACMPNIEELKSLFEKSSKSCEAAKDCITKGRSIKNAKFEPVWATEEIVKEESDKCYRQKAEGLKDGVPPYQSFNQMVANQFNWMTSSKYDAFLAENFSDPKIAKKYKEFQLAKINRFNSLHPKPITAQAPEAFRFVDEAQGFSYCANFLSHFTVNEGCEKVILNTGIIKRKNKMAKENYPWEKFGPDAPGFSGEDNSMSALRKDSRKVQQFYEKSSGLKSAPAAVLAFKRYSQVKELCDSYYANYKACYRPSDTQLTAIKEAQKLQAKGQPVAAVPAAAPKIPDMRTPDSSGGGALDEGSSPVRQSASAPVPAPAYVAPVTPAPAAPIVVAPVAPAPAPIAAPAPVVEKFVCRIPADDFHPEYTPPVANEAECAKEKEGWVPRKCYKDSTGWEMPHPKKFPCPAGTSETPPQEDSP